MREQIEAVQRMQEYIERHLCERISFAELAKVSLFSPWHARRLFLEYTGVTPAEYIRKLRLKQSALKLRDEDVKVLDVALVQDKAPKEKTRVKQAVSKKSQSVEQTV